MQFSKLPPLAKIGIWIGLFMALATALQAGAWLLGLSFDILSGSGRGVLLALALASLLMVMAADKRPVAQFGLFVGPKWKHLWLSGLAAGAATISIYLLVAVACGAMTVRTDGVTAGRSATALAAAMTTMPLALVQQMLFSGYLLSMLRQRYRGVTAVLGCAFMFAVLGRLDRFETFWQLRGQSLVIGLFLVATLLGILRLRTGNIIFPSGLLAGWMFVQRFGQKSGLLVPDYDSPAAVWLAPFGDVRQGPILWLCLAAGIVVCAYLLIRRGETEPPEVGDSIDASFKKIFPFSHTNGMATLDVWLRCLAAARFRVGLKYVPRLVAILVCSTINTIVSLPERLVLPLLLRKRRVKDPVLVVGFYRSGTTHLHNLLALDPQFCTPRNYHVMNPAGCTISGWLLTTLLGAFLPWKRPMDSVRFSLFSAAEDEFALAGLTHMSPYWGMTFPKQWPQFDRYNDPQRLTRRERTRWRRQLLLFLRKVTLWSEKQPLMKNPCSTSRVEMLNEIFPDIRIIHIHRNPYNVWRSNEHLAREGHVLNQLQDPDPDCSYQARFLDNYRAMEEVFYRDAAQLPPDRVIDLGFEELERDPVAEVRNVYATLGLTFTAEYEDRLRRYLDSVADYQKNRHRELPDGVRRQIDEKMGPLMQRWGYADAKPSSAAA